MRSLQAILGMPVADFAEQERFAGRTLFSNSTRVRDAGKSRIGSDRIDENRTYHIFPSPTERSATVIEELNGVEIAHESLDLFGILQLNHYFMISGG